MGAEPVNSVLVTLAGGLVGVVGIVWKGVLGPTVPPSRPRLWWIGLLVLVSMLPCAILVADHFSDISSASDTAEFVGTDRAGAGALRPGQEDGSAGTDLPSTGSEALVAAEETPQRRAQSGTESSTPSMPRPVSAEPADGGSRERVAAAGMGILTISSVPRAQVIVDGRYVRYSPLFRYEVESGARVVNLITDDGRRTTFSIDVPDGGEARRVWSFQSGDFVGQ